MVTDWEKIFMYVLRKLKIEDISGVKAKILDYLIKKTEANIADIVKQTASNHATIY